MEGGGGVWSAKSAKVPLSTAAAKNAKKELWRMDVGWTAVTTQEYWRVATEYGEVRYKAFGDQRYASGTTPTTFKFTGQRQESSLGIYYYGARWYDSALGRWLSPDSIIPAQQGVMGNDRYAYVSNNPIIHTDPTGHYEEGDCTTTGSSCGSPQSTSSSASAYTPFDPPHTSLATVSYALNAAAAFVDGIRTGLELSMGGAGNVIYKTTLNKAEMILSWASTATTTANDLLVDGKLDSEASYISLGASIVGGISPSATIDLIIDTYVAGYSAGAFKGIISGENVQRDPKVDWLYPEPEQQEQYIPIITKNHTE